MGANGFDRTGRRSGCMSRMSVGLAKNPATFFNWQLTVAYGCLNKAARSGGFFPADPSRASISGIAERVFRDAKVKVIAK